MKTIYSTLLFFALSVCSMLGQGGPVIRNVVTTNQFMNNPSDGWIAIWNNVAKKWSNGVNTASATNNAQPPSTILTNLSNTGAITNLNDNQFSGESTIASIKDGASISNAANFGTFTNLYGGLNLVQMTNPPPPSAALGAAGVLSGDYDYAVTYMTADGETAPIGNGSAIVSPASQQVTVTIPIATGNARVNARRVYRTEAFGVLYFFLTNFNDNSTVSFSDNVPDANLGLLAHAGNLSGGSISVNGVRLAFFDPVNYNLTIGNPLTTTNSAGTFNMFMGGLNATNFLSGSGNTLIGNQAGKDLTNGTGNMLLGLFAGRLNRRGDFNVLIGQDAISQSTNISRNVAIGRDTAFQANSINDSILIGDFAGENHTSGSFLTYIGRLSGGSPTLSNTMAIGYTARATSTNQAVIGGTNILGYANDAYIGQGVQIVSPPGTTIHATSGLGTDNAGGPLKLAAGQGTGSGAGGNLQLQVAPAGTTGSSLNPLITGLTVSNNLTAYIHSNLVAVAGVKLSGLTASRALTLNSSGDVTNAAGTPDGTKFLRDDNTYATPPGGSGSTNNVAQGIGTADITNAVKRYVVRYNNDTNIVVDWTKTNYVVAWPSNTFTVSWINVPAGGTPAQSIFLEIVNTNSTAGFFPTNGLNNSPVIMLSAPSTNTYTFNFDGTNFWTESGQILTTGLGDTNVFNISPTLHTPTNNNPTIADAGGSKVTFDFGASFTAGDSLVLHNTSGLVTNKTAGPTLLSNSLVVVNGTQSLTNASRVIFVETNQPLESIVEGAAAGTVIVLGAGTNFVSGAINVPHGVSIYGQGGNVSFIQSSVSSSIVIVPGSDSVFQNFGIKVSDRTTIVSPFGTIPGAKAFTNVEISQIFFDAETDFLYIENASPIKNLLVRDCWGKCKWDTIAISSNGLHEVWINDNNFTIDQSGAAYAGITNGSSDVAAVRWHGAGLIHINNTRWTFTNLVAAATNTTPYLINDSRADAGLLTMKGCTISADPNFQWKRFHGSGSNKKYVLEDLTINGRETGPNVTPAVYVNGKYTNLISDTVVMMPSGSARTNVLINASINGGGAFSGSTVTIIDDTATASGTNIAITTQSGQTINGAASTSITTDRGSVTLLVRGTNWVTVADKQVEFTPGANVTLTTNGSTVAIAASGGGETFTNFFVRTADFARGYDVMDVRVENQTATLLPSGNPAAGTAAAQNVSAGAPYHVKYTSTATSNNNAGWIAGAQLLTTERSFYFATHFATSLTNGTQMTFIGTIPFTGLPSIHNPADSICFRYAPILGGDTTKWVAYSANSGSGSQVTNIDTGITVTNDAWYTFAITKNATTIKWYINGSAVATNTDTTSFPAGANVGLAVGTKTMTNEPVNVRNYKLFVESTLID